MITAKIEGVLMTKEWERKMEMRDFLEYAGHVYDILMWLYLTLPRGIAWYKEG